MEHRLRFCPSPSGPLHLSGARTALLNWLTARRWGGKLLLRIDDTDPGRRSEERAAAIVDNLCWLGVTWDQGPVFQSHGAPRHLEVVRELLSRDVAYRDFGIDHRSSMVPHGLEGEVRRPRESRDMSPDESRGRAEAGEPFSVRLRVDSSAEPVSFEDRIFGAQCIPRDRVEDFTLLRRDGTATYHLATVVDDVEDAITLVMRGQEHIPSTVRQLLLYEALGATPPAFAHLPMLTRPSKRRENGSSATIIRSYREAGLPPRAMRNYLALLGFYPPNGRQLFLQDEELIDSFTLERVGRRSPRVDWWLAKEISRKHVERMALPELARLVKEELLEQERPPWPGDEQGDQKLHQAVNLTRRGSMTVVDLIRRGRGLFDEELVVPTELLEEVCQGLPLRAVLGDLVDALEPTPPEEWGQIRAAVAKIAGARELPARTVMYVLRVALTGEEEGPPLGGIVELLGVERTVRRLRALAEQCCDCDDEED